MADRPDASHTDAHLARLLEVERRVEGRIREAETAARARVDAARQAALGAARERSADFDDAARAEQAAEFTAQEEELCAISAESAARVARLEAVRGPSLERLVQRALAIVLERPDGGAP